MPSVPHLKSPPLVDRDQLQSDIGSELIVAGRRWRTRLNDCLKSSGTTEARLAALHMLVHAPHGATQTDLAARLRIQGPSLVKLLDSLELQDLVRRHTAANDRRAKTVAIRPAGRELLGEIDRLAKQFRDEMFEGVPDASLSNALLVLQHIAMTPGEVAPNGAGDSPDSENKLSESQSIRSVPIEHPKSDICLIYSSTIALSPGANLQQIVRSILTQAQHRNSIDGITGMLVFTGATFIQALEGEKEKVVATFARIKRDARHTRVTIVYQAPISKRRFGMWSMCARQLSTLDNQILDRFDKRGGLSPKKDAGPLLLDQLEGIGRVHSVYFERQRDDIAYI